MKFVRLHRVLLLLTVLGFGLPVEAQPGPGGGRFARERQGGVQRPLPPRRDDSHFQRRGGDRAGGEDARRALTPEQRRELRRDIGDAGREIYRPHERPHERPLPDRPRRFEPRDN